MGQLHLRGLAELTHSIPAPRDVLLEKGPQIVEGKGGGELKNVKPFTPEVRAEIDNELVAKSVDFMKRQATAKKPFFLYLPFSMGHIPNLPSAQFKGKSRIGQYGDKLMEGDFHVGQILDAIKQLGIDDNTLLVFCSDNGPSGGCFRELGNHGTPDMGNAGPFRGELGEVTEGSVRTFCFVRWPGHVKPGSAGAIILPGKSPDDAVISLGAFDPSGQPNTAGFNTVGQDGTLFTGEARVKTHFFGRTGHQLVGGIYSDKLYGSLDQNLRLILDNRQLVRTSGAWAVYYNFDQYLFETRLPSGKTRGWGVFGRFGAADADVLPIQYFWSLGLGGRGLIDGGRNNSDPAWVAGVRLKLIF